MSRYRREIDTQCCNAWMQGIRTINGQYPDDNRDFDINAGSGIRIEPATGGVTIINDSAASSFVEGDNIEITPSGDDLIIGVVSDPQISGNLEVNGTTTLNDTLQVNGDIIQNGAAYETHAEKVYTTNDYIITRDGAVSALSAGDYSGFQVKKYDGTNDGRLVIDNAGVARVGDVGDEQPLMTRSESASMTNGNLLQWNGTGQKAVDAGVNTSQIVRGSGNIGSDTKPVKVVNGVAVEVANAFINSKYSSYQGNVSVPAGYTATLITSVTVPKGNYIIIGQVDYNQGNGEITAGFKNGNAGQVWTSQYNSSVNNFNHLNFSFTLTATEDNTIIGLWTFCQNARTVEGRLALIKLLE